MARQPAASSAIKASNTLCGHGMVRAAGEVTRLRDSRSNSACQEPEGGAGGGVVKGTKSGAVDPKKEKEKSE